MKQGLHGLGWAAALVLCIAFLVLDPGQTLGSSMLGYLPGAGVAGLGFVAMLGAGGALLQRVDPKGLEGALGGLRALGIGMALCWVGVGLLATAGLATRIPLGLLVGLMSLGWLARPRVAFPRIGALELAFGAIFLGPGLVDALAPPTDTDLLYYHLSLPRRIAEYGYLIGGFDHPDGSRPLPVHLISSLLYGLGGEVAPGLWHWLLTAALLLGLREAGEEQGPGRGNLAVLALVGSWSFLRESGLPYNNLPVALWLLLATDALLRGAWTRMAWMAGLALSAKYTAAPVVLALVAIGGLQVLRREGLGATLRQSPAIFLGILVPVLPWWLRNLAEGLHPLFPYAGWPEGMEFMYPEKYGLGRDLAAMVLLPLNLLFRADIDSYAFLGRLSLLWGGLLVGYLWTLSRREPGKMTENITLGAVLLLGFLGWANGPHWLRYLLPLAGIAGLAAIRVRPSALLWLLWLVSLPANYLPLLASTAEKLPVVTGHQSRDAFLELQLPAWPALRYLREYVPKEQEVALLFAWHGYYLPQPFLFGSVEDHVPSRFLMKQGGETTLSGLRDRGVQVLLVGERPFLRKEFAFLDEATWRDSFDGPHQLLQRLLLQEATLLFREKGYAVWRLAEKREPLP